MWYPVIAPSVTVKCTVVLALLFPLWIVLLIGGTLLLLATTFYAWKYQFNAVDGAPMLPALIGPIFGWAATSVDLFWHSHAEEHKSTVPALLANSLSVAGAVVVTFFCWVWMYRSLKDRWHTTWYSSWADVR